MGQYCSNPLQYLIDEYGEDVGKMIVIEKSKEYLNQKFPEVKTELAGQTQKMETKIMGEVDTQTKSAMDNILSKVKEVKESKKHEIELFEKTTHKKVDDMLGVNELTHKVDDLKNQSSVKVKEMSSNILKEADTIAVKQNELLDSQKPKIPAYDNLPQCLKDRVWEEGNKKFGEQIEAEKKKQESFIKDSLNLDNLKKKFGAELPTDQVKKISHEFDEKFNTVKTSIDAGSIGGKLGSLFGH